jgi:hypothetical protein
MTPEREIEETRVAQTIQGGEELDPERVGELVADAVQNEVFLILPEPELHGDLLRRRATDLNAFLRARLAQLGPS